MTPSPSFPHFIKRPSLMKDAPFRGLLAPLFSGFWGKKTLYFPGCCAKRGGQQSVPRVEVASATIIAIPPSPKRTPDARFKPPTSVCLPPSPHRKRFYEGKKGQKITQILQNSSPQEEKIRAGQLQAGTCFAYGRRVEVDADKGVPDKKRRFRMLFKKPR